MGTLLLGAPVLPKHTYTILCYLIQPILFLTRIFFSVHPHHILSLTTHLTYRLQSHKLDLFDHPLA